MRTAKSFFIENRLWQAREIKKGPITEETKVCEIEKITAENMREMVDFNEV